MRTVQAAQDNILHLPTFLYRYYLLVYTLPVYPSSEAIMISGSAASARNIGIWSSETVDSVNGGGSTLIGWGGPNFPYYPILAYSSPQGLFVAREDAD